MQLTQGENRLSVRLLVKRDQHSKLARVIILVETVIDLDQTRPRFSRMKQLECEERQLRTLDAYPEPNFMTGGSGQSGPWADFPNAARSTSG